MDHDAIAATVERQVCGGVDVICACGAIAQPDQLSDHEWQASVETVCAAVDGRVPVLVAIRTAPSCAERASWVKAAGATGALAIPDEPSVHALRCRLDELDRVLDGGSLVLYHRPPLLLSPSELGALCRQVPSLIGLKDGHRDVRLFRQLRSAVGDRLTWISAYEDVALPFWALGADAFAPVSSAYAPAYSRAWYSCLQSGDLDGAARLLESHAYPLADLRFSRPAIEISVVKRAMEAAGVNVGPARAPQDALTPAEERSVDDLVARLPVLA